MGKFGLIAALAALALAVDVASGHRVTFPTTVDDDWEYSTGAGQASIRGNLLSPRRACLGNRVVRMVAITNQVPEVFSVDRTSDNGFFGGRGKISSTQADDLRVKGPPKRLGRHRRCGGFNVVLFPPG